MGRGQHDKIKKQEKSFVTKSEKRFLMSLNQGLRLKHFPLVFIARVHSYMHKCIWQYLSVLAYLWIAVMLYLGGGTNTSFTAFWLQTVLDFLPWNQWCGQTIFHDPFCYHCKFYVTLVTNSIGPIFYSILYRIMCINIVDSTIILMKIIFVFTFWVHCYLQN